VYGSELLQIIQPKCCPQCPVENLEGRSEIDLKTAVGNVKNINRKYVRNLAGTPVISVLDVDDDELTDKL
jgi:hypothetical protein